MPAPLRPPEGRPRARLREGVPDRLDPVRGAGRASRACVAPRRDAAETRRDRCAPLRRESRRRRRRLRRVLPAARRARGLRAATGPGRDDPPPRGDLEDDRDRGGRARSRDRRHLLRRQQVRAAEMVPRAEPRSYYGRPVIKAPVWKPEIPFYLFTGGLTGASAMLAWVAGVTGNRRLGRNARIITLAAGTASPVLMIRDLGRPARFFNMLRVFKVTSPMSVGSWVLAATGGAAATATATERFGLLPRLGRLARGLSALLGLPLATYTAALLSNSAVPVWHEARRELPFVFAGSAAASAGAAAVAVTPVRDARAARRLVVLRTVAGGAAMQLMERRLGELGEPYRPGGGSAPRK